MPLTEMENILEHQAYAYVHVDLWLTTVQSQVFMGLCLFNVHYSLVTSNTRQML